MRALATEGRPPRMIVLENVCGALTSHEGKDFAAIGAALAGGGYQFGRRDGCGAFSSSISAPPFHRGGSLNLVGPGWPDCGRSNCALASAGSNRRPRKTLKKSQGGLDLVASAAAACTQYGVFPPDRGAAKKCAVAYPRRNEAPAFSDELWEPRKGRSRQKGRAEDGRMPLPAHPGG